MRYSEQKTTRAYLADIEIEPVRHPRADTTDESAGVQHRHVLRQRYQQPAGGVRQRGQGDRGSPTEAFGAEAGDEGADGIGDDAEGRDPRGLRLLREAGLEELRYQNRAVSLRQSHGDLADVRGQAREDLRTSRISQ